MAEDAVDAAIEVAGLSARPCRTRHLPVVGAANSAVLGMLTAPQALVQRYGAEASLLAADPSRLERVAPGIDITRAEVEFAVSHEGALDVDDVLDRRTRIGLVPRERARAEEAVAAAFG
jgi:glycerol-3-phosphate dehydrogenase